MENKKTPLYETHRAQGAKMVEFSGYQMPVQYSSAIEEHFAVRQHAGLFDVSHMGQFKVWGNQAADFLQFITSNDVFKLVPGKAQYSCLPTPQGGIVDDLVLYQLAEKDYLAVVNAGNIQKDWDWFNQHAQAFDVQLENQSDQWALLALQGPKAHNILLKLIPDLTSIAFYHFVQRAAFGEKNVIVSATGYTGSGGYELYVPAQAAEKIWNALMEAGLELGLKPCGLACRDTLRLEKGYMLYGNDITEETSVLEAGLGWITKLDTDFVGKEFLAQQKAEGIGRILVGFVMTDRGIPRKDYPLLNAEGQNIGQTTSGSQSPLLKVGIGLGYVQKEYAGIGQKITVDCRGKLLEAKVVKLPFV